MYIASKVADLELCPAKARAVSGPMAGLLYALVRKFLRIEYKMTLTESASLSQLSESAISLPRSPLSTIATRIAFDIISSELGPDWSKLMLFCPPRQNTGSLGLLPMNG